MADWMDSFSSPASTGTAVAPAAPSLSPTEPVSQGDWMDSYKPAPNPNLSLKASIDIPPDKAAQVLKLNDQTGIPTHVIASDPESVQAKQNQVSLSPDFIDNHPKTAELVGSDPHWAALLRDDIPGVGYMERQLDYLTNASMRSELELERTYHGLKGVAGIGGPDNSDRVAQIDKQLQTQFAPPAGASQVTQLFGKAAEVAPYAAPLALGAAPGVAAGAAGAMAFGAMETANAYLDYKNKVDQDGVPIPDVSARRWAVASGALTAALSTLGPAAAEANPAMKMLSRGALGEMLENTGLRTAVDKLLTSSIPESMLKTGAFFGGSTWGHIAAGVMADSKGMSPMAILRTIFSPENNKQVIKAAGTGAAVGGTMTAGMGAWKIWTDFSKATDALNTQTAWANVGNAMKETKAFDMAPEMKAKVMERLAGDGHTYIPLEKWQEWAEKQKVDPREAWAQATGDTRGYDEALKTGGDLQMSSKNYAAKIAASDHNDFFSKVLRNNPEAMNAEEAESFLGKQTPQKEAERAAVFKIQEEVAPTPKEPEPAPAAQPPAVVPTTPEQAMAEEHIQAAKEDLGHKPLNLEGMGMTETQEAGIREAELRAHLDAGKQMLKAITDRQRRTATKEWMDERREVQTEVEQEANALSEYQAMTALKAGVHPEEVANMHGFESEDEMNYKISQMPKMEDLVHSETDRRMQEAHPELANETNMPETAVRAIYNNAYGDLLRKQLQHFYSDEFAAAKGLMGRIAGRIPVTEELKADVNRDIAAKNYRELQPRQYIQAMRNNQVMAEKSLKAGELQNMVDAKRAELRSFEMYRAAQDAREAIEDRIQKIAKYSKKSYQEMLGKAGGTFREDVNALLSNSELQDYKSMPYGRLMDYLDQIQSKVHEAREQGKLYALEKFQKMDDYRSAFIEQLATDHNLTENELGFPKPKISNETPFLPSAQAHLTRMEFYFDALDKDKPMGLAKQGFSEPVAASRGHEGDLTQKQIDSLDKLVSEIPFSERALWYSKLHYIPEIKMSLLRQNMIRIARYRQNDYTWKALLDGYGWSDAQGMAVISKLTAKELDLVDGMSKWFEAMKPEAFEKYKQIHGIAPKAVEASPHEVMLADGMVKKMEGGYSPVTFANSLAKGGDAVEDAFGDHWGPARPSESHLKARTDTGKRPLSLELNDELRVMGQMIHWVSFVDAVSDANKIIGDKAIRAHMIAAGGEEAFKEIPKWLKATAGNNPFSSTPVSRLLGWAKGASMIANLGLKTTSEIKHVFNYTMAIKELGPQYGAKGVQTFLGNPMKTRERWDEIKSMSPYMRQWAANWDRDIGAAAKRMNIGGYQSILGSSNIVGRALSIKEAVMHNVVRTMFSLYGVAYTAIGGSAWEGAYMKAMDGEVEGMKAGDADNAIKYADRTVRTTIAAGNIEDLPSLMRDTELGKLVTWFYGPMNLLANNVQKDYRRFAGSEKAPRDIAKFATAELLNVLPAALMSSLIAGEGPKLKDKAKKWVEWGAGAIASEFAGMIPLLRDVPYMIKTKGHSFGDPFTDVLSSPIWATVDMAEHIGSHKKFGTKEIKDLGMTAGYLTEMPSRQVMDSWAVAHDWLSTHHYRPSSTASGIFHVLTGKEPR